MQDFLDIIDWYKKNTRNTFNVGASENDVLNFKRKFPMLSQSMLDIYRICNGQDQSSIFIDGMRFFSINKIIENHSVNSQKYNDLVNESHPLLHDSHSFGAVKAIQWSSLWIPIFGTDEGQFVCLDFDPPPDGFKGQLIDIQLGDEDRFFVKPSLDKYFSCIKNKLSSGKYSQNTNTVVFQCDDTYHFRQH